ncbi:hypothetical protein LMG26689_01020 [Achromobacter animicus]|nr:hypothetical protein LMG26689_01020 [Achromobacter animicus]
MGGVFVDAALRASDASPGRASRVTNSPLQILQKMHLNISAQGHIHSVRNFSSNR